MTYDDGSLNYVTDPRGASDPALSAGARRLSFKGRFWSNKISLWRRVSWSCDP